MVPPFLISMVAVVSLLVQTTSGVSSVMRVFAVQVISGAVTTTLAEAFTVADLMPVASSAPVFGSYSITAPSGKVTCMASADADGAGNSSEKTAGHHKGGIQLTAQTEQQNLFTDGRCPPGTGAPCAGSQPVQPVGDIAAGVHATGAGIQIHLGNGANSDQVAQQARDVVVWGWMYS